MPCFYSGYTCSTPNNYSTPNTNHRTNDRIPFNYTSRNNSIISLSRDNKITSSYDNWVPTNRSTNDYSSTNNYGGVSNDRNNDRRGYNDRSRIPNYHKPGKKVVQ